MRWARSGTALTLGLSLLVGACAALRGGAPGGATTPSALVGQAPDAPGGGEATSAPRPSTRGVVATAHPLASEAGARMLAAGGTAFDAAVAAALVLGVVDPQSSGIGGGGFAVYTSQGGPPASLDFRETAPSFFDATTFLAPDRDSARGPWSTGVPGEVAGLGALHSHGGALPWSDVVEPARAIAADGFAVGASLGRALGAAGSSVLADPGLRADFAPDGVVLETGAVCRRPALARTLEYIQLHGPRGFYEGPIALSLAGFLAAQGVPWTPAELSSYAVRPRPVVSGQYRGHAVHTMGPPSSGGIAILQILGLLERGAQYATPWGSPAWTRALAQASSHAFADRATYGGDPDHVEVPVADLLDADSLDAVFDRTPARGPVPLLSAGVAGLRGASAVVVPDDGGTSHLSVLDGLGNAIALTTTVNLWFGSGQADPQTGVVLNDEMDDFAARPGVPNSFGLIQSAANAPGAGRRPLSSMSPTLVTDPDGRVVLATGAAGGPRIISATLQVILAVLDRGATAQDAVATPRIHHQWLPQSVDVEAAYPPEGRAALLEERFPVGELTRYAVAQAAMFDPATGAFTGAGDPRAAGDAVLVEAPAP